MIAVKFPTNFVIQTNGVFCISAVPKRGGGARFIESPSPLYLAP